MTYTRIDLTGARESQFLYSALSAVLLVIDAIVTSLVLQTGAFAWFVTSVTLLGVALACLLKARARCREATQIEACIPDDRP